MKNEIVYNIKIKDCRRVQYDSYILLTAFWQYEDFREWFNWCFVFLLLSLLQVAVNYFYSSWNKISCKHLNHLCSIITDYPNVWE